MNNSKDVNNVYRKILALLFVLILAISSSADEYTQGDVIVVLKPSAKAEVSASSLSIEASEFAEVSGASVREFYPALSEKGGSAFMMLHSDSMDAEEFSALLMKNPNVAAVSPNYKVHAAIVPNDTSYGECWGMDYIEAPNAWDISTGDEEIYVAVIDSGIDYTNPDLSANVARDLGYDAFTESVTGGMDDYGHGTHVAGTIGAVGNNQLGVAGVNWDVKMIPVKALDSSGSGTFDSVISAMDYVTDLVDQGYNVRAVNLSLETYLTREPNHDSLVTLPLWRAFKILDDTNQTVIVVAAGNNKETVGEPSSYKHDAVPGAGYYVYPASFAGLDNMITVSALAQVPYTGTTYTALFSNKGADIGAPGVDILSTWLQSSRDNIRSDGVSLRSAQGTSMAAPHVAGAAALIASVMPTSATAYQIKQAIIISDELDVYASLNYADANFDGLAAQGTAGRYYDDYMDYDINDYSEPSEGGSSGACNGLGLGISGLLFAMVLARKRMS